jgi:hypothetical protein
MNAQVEIMQNKDSSKRKVTFRVIYGNFFYSLKKEKRQKKGKNNLIFLQTFLSMLNICKQKKVIRRLAASFYSKCQKQSVASFFLCLNKLDMHISYCTYNCL